MRKEDRLTKAMYVSSLLASVMKQAELEMQNFSLNDWMSVFSQMIDDETIEDAADKFSSIVVANIVTYKHKNKEIEAFVKENLDKMQDSFVSVMKVAVKDMNNFGFHCSEIVYQYDKESKKMRFKKFVRLPPEIVRFVVNKKGDVVKANVYGAQPVSILRDKLFVATNGVENGVYGKSRLRKAYRWWKAKKHLIEFWAIALEKYAIPPLVGKTNSQNQDEVLEALTQLYSNGAMVVDREDEIVTIEGRKDFPELFERTLRIFNTMIYRSYLIPSLLGDIQSVGSYALGKIQIEPFYVTTRVMAQTLVEQFLSTAVKSLLEINGFDTDDVGEFVVINEPSSEEKWRMGQLIYQLTNVGYLDPQLDNEWVRTLLRFSPKGGENNE